LKYKILGDPTEGSLLVLAKKAEIDIAALSHEHQRIHLYPFNSVRKMMSSVHMTPQGIRSYSKGAPDVILDNCSHILKEDGKVHKITAKDKKDILDQNEAMASNAYRVLAMCYRDLPNFDRKAHHEDVESNMTFVGLSGMMDPPRSDVKEAIKMAHKAGIKVAIVTGDFGTTAKAVAKKIGLTDHKEAFVVSGTELNKISDHELVKIVKREKNMIFARVAPEHKLRVVNALKHAKEIVAVTGDGVNDAPALKRADIGVSMGITGTDVLPALALGVDSPEPGIMDRPPRDQSKPIMSRNFIAHFLFIGLFIGGAVVGTYLYVLLGHGWWFGEDLPTDTMLYVKASTMAFVLLVLIQMVNAFNARSAFASFWKMGLFTNMWLVGSILISIAMVFAMVHVPFLQQLLHTSALSTNEWTYLFIVAIAFLFIEEIRKLTVRLIREPA